MPEAHSPRLSWKNALTTMRVDGEPVSCVPVMNLTEYRGSGVSLLVGTSSLTPVVEVRRNLLSPHFFVRGSADFVGIFSSIRDLSSVGDSDLLRPSVTIEGDTRNVTARGYTELTVGNISKSGIADEGGKLLVTDNAAEIVVSGGSEADVRGVLVNQANITGGTFHAHTVEGMVRLVRGVVKVDTNAEEVIVDEGLAAVNGVIFTARINTLQGHVAAATVVWKEGITDNILETDKLH